MKYLDEFRNVKIAKTLIEKIRRTATRAWVLMDVCGGQTHSLLRYGIEQELSGHVELIHGPGCPVCVTSAELIDFAVALSLLPDTLVTSFGDMIRVPGSTDSLMQSRSKGGDVRIVYSPIDALTIAKQNPQTQVVFFAVGFETTAPATALAVIQAAKLGIENFYVVPAHVRVLPAMETIMQLPDNRVEAFLAAGHVCAITGYELYEPFVSQFQAPVVVTGFEPTDLLEGILKTVTLLESGKLSVENCYSRSVQRKGNVAAMNIIDLVYEKDDRQWRGFGTISGGGYRLRRGFRKFDALNTFPESLPSPSTTSTPCRGAEVMSGRIKPQQCDAFGTTCTPESPQGAPMVSSEGACAAYFRYELVQIGSK